MIHHILSIASIVLLCLTLLAGVLMVPFTLPGTWVIVGAALLYSLVGDFHNSPRWLVVSILAGLAVVGEMLDYAASAVSAKKENVPAGAVICSILGGLVGAVIGVPVFLIGALLGLLIGTFLGAFVYSLIRKKIVSEAFRDSFVILTSRIISIFAKTALAMGMSVYVLFKVF